MATNPGVLRIGEVAARAGVKIDTVRFYERRGVLPVAPRRASGYRAFLPETVTRIQFAKEAQAMGFSLDEIVEVLALLDAGDRSCAELKDVARKTLARVDAKLAALTAVRDKLGSLVARCDAPPGESCGPLVQIRRALAPRRPGR